MKTIDEASKEKSSCLIANDEIEYSLKRNHDYFFQVQCQMYCDNKEWCDFVVCTEKDIHIERDIQRQGLVGERDPYIEKHLF